MERQDLGSEDVVDLVGQLARGADDDGGDIVLLEGVVCLQDLVDDGDEVGEGLSGAGDGLDDDIDVSSEERNGCCLNGGHARAPAVGVDGIEDPVGQRRGEGIPSAGVFLGGCFWWHTPGCLRFVWGVNVEAVGDGVVPVYLVPTEQVGS